VALETMTATELALRIAGGLALVAGNALFVLTEFALTRARHVGGDAFGDAPSLRRAWKMTEELEIYLTGCQLGISTMSVLLGVIAEPGVTALLRPAAGWLGLHGTALSVTSVVTSVALINLVHKVWGEQAPTYFGVEAPVKAARIGAPIVYVWTKVFYPLVLLGDGLAKATLRLFGVEVTRSWVNEEHPDPRQLRRAVLDAMVEGQVPSDRREALRERPRLRVAIRHPCRRRSRPVPRSRPHERQSLGMPIAPQARVDSATPWYLRPVDPSVKEADRSLERLEVVEWETAEAIQLFRKRDESRYRTLLDRMDLDTMLHRHQLRRARERLARGLDGKAPAPPTDGPLEVEEGPTGKALVALLKRSVATYQATLERLVGPAALRGMVTSCLADERQHLAEAAELAGRDGPPPPSSAAQ